LDSSKKVRALALVILILFSLTFIQIPSGGEDDNLQKQLQKSKSNATRSEPMTDVPSEIQAVPGASNDFELVDIEIPEEELNIYDPNKESLKKPKELMDFTAEEYDKDPRYETHMLTQAEVEVLKKEIGVREVGKDYNVIINGFGTGLAPPSEAEWEQMPGMIEVVDGFGIITPSYLPATVDLSTSIHFPPVRSQRSQGSCSAWATTYYTATYLQSKDQGWNETSAGNNSHILSPAWTYNKANHGYDSGSHTWNNFHVLSSVGAATWETMPYDDRDDISWGSESAWREAPEYRFSGYSWTKPRNIDVIKSWVADGYPIPFALDAWEYSGNLGFNDDTITSTEYNSNANNHANTIVGYDDNKTADGEVGAFKVVNSYGSGWGAQWKMYGYYWMTYKAFAELNYNVIKINDRVDYEPKLLATWEFNGSCSRTADIELGIGNPSSPIDTREPKLDGGSHAYPEFMCLDITEFLDYAGLTNFYLKTTIGSNNGSVTSFKLELHEKEYNISNPTIISDESPDVNKTNPCTVYNTISGYRIKITNPEENGWYSGTITAGGNADPHRGITIISEDFEGLFPNDWVVGDSNTVRSLDYWGNSSKKPKDGFRSGWCAGVQEPIFSEDFDTGGSIPINWTTKSDVKKGNPWFVTNVDYQFVYNGDDYGAVADCNYSGTPKDITEWLYMTTPFSTVGYSKLSLEFLLEFNASGTGDSAEVYYANKSTYPTFTMLKKWTNSTIGMQELDLSVAAGEAEVYLGFKYTGTKDYYMFVDDVVVTANETINGYDDSMSAYMYQKVSLTGYDHVNLTYDFWLDSEANTDNLSVIYYQNSNWYYMDEHNGSSTTWKESYAVIPTSATRVGFLFKSDASNSNYQGVFVDNVRLTGYINLSSVEVKINSGSWSSATGKEIWSYSLNTNSYSEGKNEIFARAKYGSYYSYDKNNFYIDNTPPNSFTPVATPSSWTSNTQPVITFSTTDALSGMDHFELKIDSGSFSNESSPATLPPQSDGVHLITVRAYDKAGNHRDEVVNVYVDATAPNPFIVTATPSGWTNNTQPVITFFTIDSTSGLDRYEVKIDSGSFSQQTSPYTLPVQTDGAHNITVRAYDNASNFRDSWVNVYIDTVSPNPFTPTANPSIWTSNNQPQITFSTTDTTSGINRYEVKIDSGTFAQQTSPYTLPTQTDGIHNITVRAIDQAGNYFDGYVEVFIDTSLPEPFIPIATPGSWTNNTQPVITFTTTDNISGINHYEIKIDGGTFTTQTSPYTLSVLTDGLHTITVRAIDNASNYRDAIVLVYIDTAKPISFSVTTVPSGWTNNDTPMIYFSAIDTLSGINRFELKIDSGSFSQQTSPYTLPSQSDGIHNISVRAYDNASNYDEINVNVYIDTIEPSLFIPTSNPSGWTSNNQPVITFSTTDSLSGMDYYQVSIDSGIFSNQTSPYILPVQTDGIHNITIRAFDNAGNYRDGYVDVFVDTTLPNMFISTATPRNWTNNTQPIITFETSDLVSGINRYEVKIDNGSFSQQSSPYTLPVQTDGTHNITVRAYDNASNYRDSWVNVFIDSSLPIPFIPTANPSGWTNNNQPQITFSTTDGTSGIDYYMVRIDSGTFCTQTSPFTLPVQNDGVHNITVRAFDRAGNYREGYVDVYVDATTPNSFTPTANPSTWTNNTQPVVTFSATDNTSGIDHYEIKIDSGAYTTQTSPYSLPILTDGLHTITVRAIDKANNFRDGVVVVYIDSVKPISFSVTADPSDWTNNDSPTISFSAVDALSGINRFEVKIDSGSFSQQTSPYTLPNQTDGTHNITIRVYDNASNYREAWVNVYIDTVSPNPFTPLANPGTWTSNDKPVITFATTDSLSGIDHYQISIDSSLFTNQTSPYTLPSQPDGIHNITVRAFDMAGNFQEEYVNVYIDTSQPNEFLVTASPSGWTNNSQPVITFSTTDSVSGIDRYVVKIDSGPFTTQTSPYTLPSQSDGMHNITVRAYDLAGNYRDAFVDVYIDTTKPLPFKPTANPSGWSPVKQPIISFLTTDLTSGIDHYMICIDNGSFVNQTSPYKLPAQSNGVHNITVRAFDRAGNYVQGYVDVYVDTSYPNPFTPTANPSSWTNNSQPTITFSTTDNTSGIDYYQVKIDNGNFTNQTSPYKLPILSDGIHTITIRAYNKAGKHIDGIVEVYIDTSKPNDFTPKVTPDSWTNTDPVLTFNTTDAFSGINYYEVKIDNGSFAIQTSPFTLSGLSDGIHIIIVRAHDNAGNYLDKTVYAYVDKTAPNAFIIQTTTGTWSSDSTPDITFSTTDATSGIERYEVKIDNGIFTTQISPYTLPVLTDGIHNITVRAYDNAGNYRDSIVRVYIDTTSPIAFTPSASPSFWTNNTRPTITFSTTDNTSGIKHYEVKIDTGAFTTRSSPYTLPALTNGVHNITVRAIDNAGNYIDSMVQVFIDTTAPDPFTPTANPSTWTKDTSPVIMFFTKDVTSGINRYEVRIDSGSFSAQTSPFTLPHLSDGIHTITVRAYNNAGNYVEGSVKVYIDASKPLNFVPMVNPDHWTNSDPILTFNTTDSVSGIDYYMVKIGSGSFSNQTSPYTILGLPDGTYLITVRAFDLAGNYIDRIVYAYIDKTSPLSFIIIASPNDWTSETKPTITFFTTDNTSGISHYQVMINDGIFTNQTSPYKLPILTDGIHEITVRAFDRAGNYRDSIVKVYIDTTPPESFEPSATPSVWTNDPRPVITFETTDLGSGIERYEIKIDNGQFNIQTSPFKLPELSDGVHNITVRVYDLVGNYRDEYVLVYIDTTSPEPFTPTVDPSGWTTEQQPIITFSTTDQMSGIDHYLVKIDNGDFTQQVSPYTLPTQLEGKHIITIRVYDLAGNYIDSTIEVFIDLTPPEKLEILINNDDHETRTINVSLKVTAQDALSGVYQISFSTDGTTWGPWIKYSEDSEITLSAGDGEKIVYFRVMDLAGNIAEPVFDIIIMNTTIYEEPEPDPDPEPEPDPEPKPDPNPDPNPEPKPDPDPEPDPEPDIVFPDYDQDKIIDILDTDDDGDGYPDVWEEELGTDPLDETSTPLDSDEDGKPDGDAANSKLWMDPDDDNDGYPDIDEIEAGTNPQDENSIPVEEENPEKDDNTLEMFNWFLITIMVLISFLIGLLIMLRRRDREHEEPETSENEDKGEDEPVEPEIVYDDLPEEDIFIDEDPYSKWNELEPAIIIQMDMLESDIISEEENIIIEYEKEMDEEKI
jgi:hypothetical protein